MDVLGDRLSVLITLKMMRHKGLHYKHKLTNVFSKKIKNKINKINVFSPKYYCLGLKNDQRVSMGQSSWLIGFGIFSV